MSSKDSGNGYGPGGGSREKKSFSPSPSKDMKKLAPRSGKKHHQALNDTNSRSSSRGRSADCKSPMIGRDTSSHSSGNSSGYSRKNRSANTKEQQYRNPNQRRGGHPNKHSHSSPIPIPNRHRSSRSPPRGQVSNDVMNRLSRSPHRGQPSNGVKNRSSRSPRRGQASNGIQAPSASMTLIVNRVDLYDGWTATGCLPHTKAPSSPPQGQIDESSYSPSSEDIQAHPSAFCSSPPRGNKHSPSTHHGHSNRGGGHDPHVQLRHYQNPADVAVAPYAFAPPDTNFVSRHEKHEAEKRETFEMKLANVSQTAEKKTIFSENGAPPGFFDDFVGVAKEEEPKHHVSVPATPATTIAVIRAPKSKHGHPTRNDHNYSESIPLENEVANPHPTSIVHDKYWSQRRRLFSRFDEGIQLDSEGWYSVTPEAIADHVARRMGEMTSRMVQNGACGRNGITILDAFCGCGGNAIAFGKLPPYAVSHVICVDMDIAKLRMAAQNAALYGIPPDKILFIEANTLTVLGQCYFEGNLIHNYHPNGPPRREQCAGFIIGGLDLLPYRIDAVFLDPPWGGIDYGSMGKNGYDLAKNMKIHYDASHSCDTKNKTPNPKPIAEKKMHYHHHFEEDIIRAAANAAATNESVNSHASPPPTQNNQCTTVDGIDLLRMAAAATESKLVLYDVPRNTSKASLGLAALSAGYRGNFKLDEHFLNGRLKTVTAYFGHDYSELLT